MPVESTPRAVRSLRVQERLLQLQQIHAPLLMMHRLWLRCQRLCRRPRNYLDRVEHRSPFSFCLHTCGSTCCRKQPRWHLLARGLCILNADVLRL